ncbi:hypothetical protein AX16_010137 [Volvariella volvacea WC 439]|nr:hypothetical protein AX16_010137 [Volvariella volvacea WC 439]
MFVSSALHSSNANTVTTAPHGAPSPARILRREWRRNKPHLPKSTSLPELQLAPADRPLFTCQQCGFSNAYIPLCLWCSWSSKPAQEAFESSAPRARRASAPSKFVGPLAPNNANSAPFNLSNPHAVIATPQLPVLTPKTAPPNTLRSKLTAAFGKRVSAASQADVPSPSTHKRNFLSSRPRIQTRRRAATVPSPSRPKQTDIFPHLDPGRENDIKGVTRADPLDIEVTYETVVGEFVVLDKGVATATSPQPSTPGSSPFGFRTAKRVEGTWCNLISKTSFSPSRLRVRRATTSGHGGVGQDRSSTERITVATNFATTPLGVARLGQDTQSPRTAQPSPAPVAATATTTATAIESGVNAMTNPVTNHSRTLSSPAAVTVAADNDNDNALDRRDVHVRLAYRDEVDLTRSSDDITTPITTRPTPNLFPTTPTKPPSNAINDTPTPTPTPTKGLRRRKHTAFLHSSSPAATPVAFVANNTAPSNALGDVNWSTPQTPTKTRVSTPTASASPTVTPKAVPIPKALPPPRPSSQPQPGTITITSTSTGTGTATSTATGKQNYAPHYLPLAFPNASTDSELTDMITHPPRSQLLTPAPPRAQRAVSYSPSTAPPHIPREASPSPTPSSVRLGHPSRPLYTAIRKNMSRPSSPAPFSVSLSIPPGPAARNEAVCHSPYDPVFNRQLTAAATANMNVNVNAAAISAQSLAPTLTSPASSRPTSNMTMQSYASTPSSRFSNSNSNAPCAARPLSPGLLGSLPSPAHANVKLTPTLLDDIFSLNDDVEDSTTLGEDPSVETDTDDERDEAQLEDLHRTLQSGILKDSNHSHLQYQRQQQALNANVNASAAVRPDRRVRGVSMTTTSSTAAPNLFASGKAKVIKKMKSVIEKGDVSGVLSSSSEWEEQKNRLRRKSRALFRDNANANAGDAITATTKKTIKVEESRKKEKKENAYFPSGDKQQLLRTRKSKELNAGAAPPPKQTASRSFSLSMAPPFRRLNGTGSLRLPSPSPRQFQFQHDVAQAEYGGDRFGSIGRGCSVSGETELRIALARQAGEESEATDRDREETSVFGMRLPERPQSSLANHYRSKSGGSEGDDRLRFMNLRRDWDHSGLDTDDGGNSSSDLGMGKGGGLKPVVGRVKRFKRGLRELVSRRM